MLSVALYYDRNRKVEKKELIELLVVRIKRKKMNGNMSLVFSLGKKRDFIVELMRERKTTTF